MSLNQLVNDFISNYQGTVDMNGSFRSIAEKAYRPIARVLGLQDYLDELIREYEETLTLIDNAGDTIEDYEKLMEFREIGHQLASEWIYSEDRINELKMSTLREVPKRYYETVDLLEKMTGCKLDKMSYITNISELAIRDFMNINSLAIVFGEEAQEISLDDYVNELLGGKFPSIAKEIVGEMKALIKIENM